MLKLDGSVKLSFLFPADKETALAYYGELRRVALYMPHTELQQVGTDGQYRMLFETLEMGAYTIRILYDVAMIVDHANSKMMVRPASGMAQDAPEAGLNVTTAHGNFYTTATFKAEGDKTRIHFSMKLNAKLLPPTSMRFVPGRMANKMAKGIADKRLKEIALGFVKNSLAAFPQWRDTTSQGSPTPQSAPPLNTSRLASETLGS